MSSILSAATYTEVGELPKEFLRKYNVVDILIRKYGYANFLEISTPTTGFTFGDVHKVALDVYHRLVYHWVDYYEDGQPFLARTSRPTSADLLRLLNDPARRQTYDCIFIDPFHSYHATMVDLTGAFALLAEGGAMVIHDCNPVRADMADPEFKVGDWCGVTYAAFIDFVLNRRDLCHYTVDCDHGCGVIFKRPAQEPLVMEPHLHFEWITTGGEAADRYALFSQHRHSLLNLISVEAFLLREAVP